MNTREAYKGVLAEPDARALIAASGASQLGDWLYNAALLGYIYTATGSAAWVGAATVCRLLPYVLFGPLGGVIADRRDKRRVLLAGDGLRCAIMVALAAVVQLDGSVALVIVLTALASIAGTAERPAAMALLPRLVGESRLGPANALLHTVQDLGVVVGPAIGALLLAVAPASVAFLVNAGTFAASAFMIATMSPQQPLDAGRAESGLASHLVEGLRTVFASPFVVPLFVVVAMVELTYGAQTVQLVVYAEQRLGLGGEGYGYLLAAAGVGGLLSAGINARLAAGVRVSWIVVGAGALFCATQIAYAGIDGIVLAVVVTVLGGIGIVACEVVAETALARIVPPAMLGRVMGVFDAASVAAMILGAVLGSVLVGATSVRSSLLVLGIGALLITGFSLVTLRGLDTLSRRRSEVLAVRISAIETLPILIGAPRVVIERLAAAAQVCPLPAGVDLVVQGAPAHAFYAVVDGELVVHRDDVEIARLGPGTYFGERGLLDSAPRNASVTTQRDSTVVRIEGHTLLDALQAFPTMLSAVDLANNAGPAMLSAEVTDLVDDPNWSPT